MKRISESEIDTIDPSQYRSFLVFTRGDQNSPAGPETQVLVAFNALGAKPHVGHVEQLLIDVENPNDPRVASRVRDALQKRADALGKVIRS